MGPKEDRVCRLEPISELYLAEAEKLMRKLGKKGSANLYNFLNANDNILKKKIFNLFYTQKKNKNDWIVETPKNDIEKN